MHSVEGNVKRAVYRRSAGACFPSLLTSATRPALKRRACSILGYRFHQHGHNFSPEAWRAAPSSASPGRRAARPKKSPEELLNARPFRAIQMQISINNL